MGTDFLLLMGNPEQGGGGASMMIMMGAIFIVMYFFMIRPQQKKAKEQKNFLAEIQKGDRIVTHGGIYGKIVKVDEDSFLLEVDSNTKIRIAKGAVSYESTKAILNTKDTAKEEKKTEKTV